MDLDQQREALEEHLNIFFETRENALWLLHHIRQKVKDNFPDEQLTQEEIREHTTNQVEGNIWRKMRVLHVISKANSAGNCCRNE